MKYIFIIIVCLGIYRGVNTYLDFKEKIVVQQKVLEQSDHKISDSEQQSKDLLLTWTDKYSIFKDDIALLISWDPEDLTSVHNIASYQNQLSWSYLETGNIVQEGLTWEKVIQKDKQSDEIENFYEIGSTIVLFKRKRVEWADPKTFRWVWSYYGVDKNSVYYRWYRFDLPDLETFTAINMKWYGKDKNFVYYWFRRFDEIDLESFEPLDEQGYWIDDYHMYFKWNIMK